MKSVMGDCSLVEFSLPFVVVEFGHDKSVGIVHQKWITKIEKVLYCYWPPFWKDNRKLKKGVLSGEVPNPTSWTLYEVKVVKGYGKFEPHK